MKRIQAFQKNQVSSIPYYKYPCSKKKCSYKKKIKKKSTKKRQAGENKGVPNMEP